MDTVTLQRLAELSAMAGHEREQELEAIVRIIATATKEELEILDIVLSNGDAKLRDIVSSSMQQRRKKLTFYMYFYDNLVIFKKKGFKKSTKKSLL
jgi:ABC-type Fe3+/spermidine/putrescine transport system ATPase subunit